MSFPWNKGYGDYIKGKKNPFFGKHHNSETRLKLKKAWEKRRLIPVSQETREKMRLLRIGKSNLSVKGERHPRWIKDRSKLKHPRLWHTAESDAWYKSVFSRDCFTCQVCGDNKGGNLNAHHKFPWKDFPQLRFDINNGITLCEKCHIEIHRL